MAKIFIDVETTGLSVFRGQLWRPLSEDELLHAAYVVQVAWTSLFPSGEQVSESYFIVPSDWNASSPSCRAAQAVHGITEDLCAEKGVPLRTAMEALLAVLPTASEVVGHNLAFDLKALMASFWRCGLGPDAQALLKEKSFVCTRRGLPKELRCDVRSSFPLEKTDGTRLSLIHRHLFGASHDNAHMADSDVRATLRCYRELEQRGHRWPPLLIA